MPINKLFVIAHSNGSTEFRCSECKGVGEYAYGAANKDQLAYVLICSGCGDILGEWLTAEERATELRDCAAKAAEKMVF